MKRSVYQNISSMVSSSPTKGREQILNVHIKNKKLADDIELTEVAKRTAGFSGADLENLMNEPAACFISYITRYVTTLNPKAGLDYRGRAPEANL